MFHSRMGSTFAVQKATIVQFASEIITGLHDIGTGLSREAPILEHLFTTLHRDVPK